MMDFLSGMIRLPMNAMTVSMDILTETARGVGRVTGEGLNYVSETLGTRTEAESCSDSSPSTQRRDTLGDQGAKLVEYVLVDLSRDQEQIVERGHHLIRRTMTEAELTSALVDAFSASPKGEGRDVNNIRAYVQILERWDS